jgi:hypothetical protein
VAHLLAVGLDTDANPGAEIEEMIRAGMVLTSERVGSGKRPVRMSCITSNTRTPSALGSTSSLGTLMLANIYKQTLPGLEPLHAGQLGEAVGRLVDKRGVVLMDAGYGTDTACSTTYTSKIVTQ